jgi:CHAT domain-containing protein
MREFYRLHEANPRWTKAEALRQAQLSLLKGSNNERGPAATMQQCSS